MSRQGQYNYSGINYQSWAAMSLFLQYLRNRSFSHIHLEAPEFQDFNLVFNNGRKIICEAKGWRKKFGFSDLKKILDTILSREKLGEDDEILLICENLDERLESKIKNIRFFKEFIVSEFEKKKFSEQQIKVLPKVNFWKVSKEINQNIIYSLFSELLNFWIPEKDLKRIVHNILIQKIYECSARGETFTRTELLTEIENLKRETVKDSGYFDKERRKIESSELLKELVEAIKDNRSPVWADNQIAALSTQPHLMYFVLQKLQNRKINLRDWEKLWRVNKTYAFSFNIFRIFENNLHSRDNRKYVLELIKKNIPDFRKFFRPSFFEIDIVRIVGKIIEQDKTLLSKAFEIVKELLKTYKNEYFYLKSNQDLEWKKEETCKLLKKIYENGNEDLKNRIYELVTDYFNLIKDDGEFSHYTPKVVFEILENYLTEDRNQFEERFLELKKILVEQYEKFYKRFGKKIKFEGWELMGGTTSFFGYDYKVSDRHFIRFVLKPALAKYYKVKPKRAWEFIVDNCVSPTNKVSKTRPDFLNRASIPIVLEKYKRGSKKISQEAFKILKEFILSRKGIPHKADLIYQDIRTNFPDGKKWQLIKISIDKYKLPVNPFVEQITLELAGKGNKEAKEIIKGWIRNPDYYEKGRPFEGNIAGIISNFLDFSFDEGVQMFKDFIAQEYFITKFDTFEVFDFARVLNKILYKDFDSGLEILNNLARKPKLGENEQIILCNSLTRKGDSTQENEEVLIKIYKEFLDPFLKSFDNNINKIEAKISRSQSREAIIEFADSLAKHKKIPETIRIVKVFINDSDPCTPAKVDPADPEAKYDEHKKIERGEDIRAITTVRGWCAWALVNCTILEGRDYIEEIINLTEKLTKDKNYYIQLMSCYSLYQLTRNRLAVMPDNKEELFFNKDKEKALKMAKKIEKIAFELLDRFLNLDAKPRDVLMKGLLKVLDRIRGLNQNDAMLLLKKISQCGEKVIGEAAPLFIYFTEFRQKDFKDWKWKLPGLYDDLEGFDNKKFQDLLKSILNRRNPEINSQFAWHFWQLTKEAMPDRVDIKNMVKYSSAFKISSKYLNILAESYDHQTFTHIYDFIKDNINEHFEECYKLWRKCLEKEREALEKLIKERQTHEIYWWPFHDNGEILMVIKERGGVKEFLDSFEFLVDYPKEVNIGDINKAVEVLQNLPSKYNQRVEKIFNEIIKRNPSFYDVREAWKKQKKAT